MKIFPKYGDIENLYKVKEILDCNLVITEKLHGQNVRFMYCKEHGLVLGSRNLTIYKDSTRNENDGHNFTKFMQDYDHKGLKKYPSYVFYGEFIGFKIQKGVTYTQSNTRDLRVFDIRDPDGNYMDWEDVTRICKELGFKTVPVIAIGMFTMENLEKFINVHSRTAVENGVEIKEGDVAEGIVLKPLKMRRDRHGEWLRAKLKCDRWKENASKPKRPRIPLNPEIVKIQEEAAEFAKTVVTEGRIHTIVDHITREGNILVDMTRTPDFLKELSADIWKEHNEIKDILDKNTQKMYNKAISAQGIDLWKKYVYSQ